MKFSKLAILYNRLKRQRLLNPISTIEDEEEYMELFRLLQPVAPVHFTRPGDPPILVHRADFNDFDLSHQFREKHQIIKGRFMGGRVAYVHPDDLERYATAFRKPISKVNPIHEDILEIIKLSGGISKEQLKEDLDYPGGEVTKALNTLQEAFLVYEDQTDTDWDTGWFDFATEWFKIKNDSESYLESVSQVILNYTKSMVFVTMPQIKDWSQMNRKILKEVMDNLVNQEKMAIAEVEGVGEGFMPRADILEVESLERELSETELSGQIRSVFMLDKSDILVRSNLSELKKRYQGHEVLQYLLIDGEFKGAVLGHWRIGPYDIENILLDLNAKESEERKEEIIDAVRQIYSPKRTAILKYNGKIRSEKNV